MSKRNIALGIYTILVIFIVLIALDESDILNDGESKNSFDYFFTINTEPR